MIFGRRSILAVAAAAAMALGTAGSARSETLIVGSYAANPPWELKLPSGEFEGFQIDMVKEIAKRMGVEVQFQDTAFPAMFSGLASGRIQIAASTLTITNARLKNQSFTQPYYDTDMALVSLKADGLKNLSEMKGKVMGGVAAGTGEAWLKENADKYGVAEIRGYDTQQNLLLDLQSGRLGGAVGDAAGFEFAFKKMPALTIVETIPTGQQFGLMLAKGSPLLERVNDAISSMKVDGSLAALHKKWIGVDAPAGSSIYNVRPIPQAQ